MKSGISKRLASLAIIGVSFVMAACATSNETISSTPVDSGTDDYVSKFENRDSGSSARETAHRNATRPVSSDTGKTSEVAGAIESNARGQASRTDNEMKDLSKYYANEASRLYSGGRYEDALQYANDAILMDSGNSLAARVKSDVEQKLGVSRSIGESMAKARSEEESALRAEAIYEINNGINVGSKLVKQGKYTAGIAKFEDVLDIIRWTDYMVETEAFELEARSRISEAEKLREDARLDDFVKIREQERRLRELEIQHELDNYREEIRNLYDLAKEYFDRKEYRECIVVLNKILREDPYNDQVARLKSIARELDQGARDRSSWEDFNKGWHLTMARIQAANVMPTSEITMPTYEWWDRINRRAADLEKNRRTKLSKEDLAVRSALENVTLSPNFDDRSLDGVISWLRDEGRINVIRASAVDGDETLTLEDTGRVKLRQALELICLQLSLSWRVENGTVIIDEEDAEAGSNVARRVFNVADLLVTLRTFRGDEPRLAGDFEGEGRFGAEEDQEDADALTVEDLAEIIEEAIDVDSWGDDGHGITYRQQDLIVRNNPDNIESVAQLLTDLRRSQGITVSIEARFITIRDDFLEDIGVDFRGIGGSPQIPPPGIPPVPAALDDIQFGNSTNPAGPGGSGNDAGFFFQDIPPSGNVRYDQRARIENLFDQALGGQRGGVGLNASGGMSFQLAFVDNPEINAIIRAVRKEERATLLTAPRLTVHNTQRAHVSLMNEVAYIRDFDTTTATGVAVADPVVDVIRDGIVLDVRPTVSADRRYVTLELRPTLATLLRPIPTFTTSLGVGTPVAIQTPILTLQRIRTTVTVPDGGSFVIGGLRNMKETQVDSGIPVISDIPLIGALFTRKGKSVIREDIIIVVSARIIDLEEIMTHKFGHTPETPR